MTKARGICLVSGGLDSTLAFIELLKRGGIVQPIFIDYHQRPVEMEREAVRRVCRFTRSKPLHASNGLDLVEIKLDWGTPVDSVWGRGIALVGIAAMWAYTHGDNWDYIALGNHFGDVGPDCKPGKFDKLLNATLLEATKGRISLELPIRDLDILTIGEKLWENQVDFLDLYSCYWDPPCGYKSVKERYRCPGCRRKILVMKAAGATRGLKRPNCKEMTYQSPLATKVGY